MRKESNKFYPHPICAPHMPEKVPMNGKKPKTQDVKNIIILLSWKIFTKPDHVAKD